ncbi:MAG: hypothetical protein WCI74_09950 [Actinomycetes bacterium]
MLSDSRASADGRGCDHDGDGRVLILAHHALLGQGLAHWIFSRSGVTAVVADACDRDAVERALSERPRLIIFERTSVVDSVCVAAASPGAVTLDITHAVGVGTPEVGCVAGMDMIVNLVSVVCSADVGAAARPSEGALSEADELSST